MQHITLARFARAARFVAVWLLAGTIIAVVLGLYGLNCASLGRRVTQIERQAARARWHRD